jgi:hypothetical protein
MTNNHTLAPQGRKLFIFVNSPRPDAYLNVVVNGVRKLDVRKVIFVYIKTSEQNDPSDGTLASRALSRTQALLTSLAERGAYEFFDGDHAGDRKPLREVYDEAETARVRSYYSEVLNRQVDFSSKAVELKNLEGEMVRIAKEKQAAVIDVTGVKKELLGDLVALALVSGIPALHALNFRPAPNFEEPWTMLLHALDLPDKKLYAYNNLLDTRVYRRAMKALDKMKFWSRVITSAACILAIWAGVLLYASDKEPNLILALTILASFASIGSLSIQLFSPKLSRS